MNSMRTVLFCLLLLITTFNKAEVLTSNYKYEVALIYKLSKFVYWPNELNEQLADTNFNICILHDLELKDALNVLRNRNIKSRPIKIWHFDFSSEVTPTCQVLFIPPSRTPYLELVFEQLKNHPILTISTITDFSKLGGMIESSITSTPININLEKIKKSGLQVDASLLHLANIVSSKE